MGGRPVQASTCNYVNGNGNAARRGRAGDVEFPRAQWAGFKPVRDLIKKFGTRCAMLAVSESNCENDESGAAF